MNGSGFAFFTAGTAFFISVMLVRGSYPKPADNLNTRAME